MSFWAQPMIISLTKKNNFGVHMEAVHQSASQVTVSKVIFFDPQAPNVFRLVQWYRTSVLSSHSVPHNDDKNGSFF